MTSDYGYLGVGGRTLSATFAQSLHARCREVGCQLPQAIELLRIAEEVAKNVPNQPRKESRMPLDNRYLGCETKLDEGEHGFMAKRGYVEMSLRVFDPDNHEIQPDEPLATRIFCLKHAAASGLYTSPAHTSVAQIEDGRLTVDAVEYERYQEWLEKQL